MAGAGLGGPSTRSLHAPIREQRHNPLHRRHQPYQFNRRNTMRWLPPAAAAPSPCKHSRDHGVVAVVRPTTTPNQPIPLFLRIQERSNANQTAKPVAWDMVNRGVCRRRQRHGMRVTAAGRSTRHKDDHEEGRVSCGAGVGEDVSVRRGSNRSKPMQPIHGGFAANPPSASALCRQLEVARGCGAHPCGS